MTTLYKESTARGASTAAKESFMWACDAHASWCARAVQEPVDWTPAERNRLTRPARWERRERGQRYYLKDNTFEPPSSR